MQGPRAGKREVRAALLQSLVLRSVVGDVLADPFLAATSKVDDGRPAEEVGSGLELEALERVALDLDREVADVRVQAHGAAYATATSAASPALATISLRFTSRVRPSLRSWRNESTNGVTA